MTLLRFWPPLPVIIRKPWRSNASNNRWRIVLNDTIPSDQSVAGILAQERFEWGYKWRHVFRRVDRVEMELLSHAIEAHVASTRGGFVLSLYEWGEALSLTGYPQFAGMPETAIHLLLEQRRDEAAAWCAKHSRFIDWAVSVGESNR